MYGSLMALWTNIKKVRNCLKQKSNGGMNMAKKAVITFTIIDKYHEKCTCNMIESLDKTFGRLYDRIRQSGLELIGNITIQFVEEE